ncbi:Gfo/Idh/MocA family protein [Streptomyces sp. NPDC059679]|uniref:Gfo/Idh/MocA family protein n=1 Tax=Streptomyces sp. NPDC059679 TaxID=3346903 RepID=UPI0036A86913
MEPTPLVLAGARGHGRWHLENIRRLTAQGLVRLAGVCELTPLTAEELGASIGTPEQSADLADLVTRTGARIAIICTPIHTHADLALAAAGRGAHLLLEKPPAPSYAEFTRMTEGLDRLGTACQIGFQSLGSHALTAIRKLISDGAIGEVTGIGAGGAWARDEDYYTRAPWAGHRSLDGRDVIDGVLTNPLAHAVATALRIDGADRAEDITSIELELFRANDIEADDTSCVRLRTTGTDTTTITVAATLCAEQPGEPYVLIHGDRGRITFWYKLDRVLLERPGHEPETTDHPRTDLLENLVAHLRDGTELLVPPHRTGAFMRVVEAIRTAPDPVRLPADAWRTEPGIGAAPSAKRRIVPGIDRLVAAGAERLALYSELRAPWAAPPAEVPHT